MNAVEHFPSVRLIAAGFGDLLLLVWLTVLYSPTLSFDFGTAIISTSILVILVPVFWFGPSRDRWLAALVSLFSLLVFGFIVLAIGTSFLHR